jgi:hypothetical protein
MRRVLTSLLVLAALAAVPSVASAQAMPGDRQGQRPGQQQAQPEPERERAPRFAPLRQRPNAGPCPFVKILYDGARYVELANNQAATANVGFTGEIQGLSSTCRYREAEPITVDMNVLFSFGRGPQAAADQRTYRYWIAVTERNSAVLAKEYFDLPVNFEGQRTAEVTEERTIVIPRADITTSGGNFEILVGFEVTPEMAEFNRSGSRFRVNAGTTAAQ